MSAVIPGLAARVAKRLWLTPPKARIREEGRAFLATGERRTVSVDGRRVVSWRWGSGPAVILMHGWGGYGAQMQGFVDPLTRAGYQAVIFDAPAHGESGPSSIGAHRTTIFDFTDALTAVAHETPSIAGVVAHSGGCTAAAWGLRSSCPLDVGKLVFIAPMGSPARYRKLFQTALGLSDDVMRRFEASTERQFRFKWSELEVPAMAERMRTPPLLVFHDKDDRETSWAEGAAIADAWPGARLQTTQGLGHNRILRDGGVIDIAVAFLSSASGSR